MPDRTRLVGAAAAAMHHHAVEQWRAAVADELGADALRFFPDPDIERYRHLAEVAVDAVLAELEVAS